MKTQELEHDEVRTKVREQYGKTAKWPATMRAAVVRRLVAERHRQMTPLEMTNDE